MKNMLRTLEETTSSIRRQVNVKNWNTLRIYQLNITRDQHLSFEDLVYNLAMIMRLECVYVLLLTCTSLVRNICG